MTHRGPSAGSSIVFQDSESIRAFLTLVILFALVATNLVKAQTLYGSIVGVVTDANGSADF
jgi:cell shape-determining protein MreD